MCVSSKSKVRPHSREETQSAALAVHRATGGPLHPPSSEDRLLVLDREENGCLKDALTAMADGCLFKCNKPIRANKSKVRAQLPKNSARQNNNSGRQRTARFAAPNSNCRSVNSHQHDCFAPARLRLAPSAGACVRAVTLGWRRRPLPEAGRRRERLSETELF